MFLQWEEELHKLDELLALLDKRAALAGVRDRSGAPSAPQLCIEVNARRVRTRPETCPDCDRTYCRYPHAARCSENSREFAVQPKIVTAGLPGGFANSVVLSLRARLGIAWANVIAGANRNVDPCVCQRTQARPTLPPRKNPAPSLRTLRPAR